MFASIRNVASRLAFRRAAVNMRTMTTEAGELAKPTSLPGAAEAGILSAMSAQVSAAAGPSSLTLTATSPAVVHIPPADDPLLHLLTNLVMQHGKRQEASRVVTKMLLHLHAFTKAPPMPILRQAVFTASPLLRCRQFKRAAKQYVFPMPLSERQRTRTALMWILKASDQKGGKHLSERLAREIIAVIKGDSQVLKQKADVHKLAVLHRGNVAKPPRVPKSNRG